VSNLILLGRYLAANPLFGTREEILEALRTIVKPKFFKDNEAAFLGLYAKS